MSLKEFQQAFADLVANGDLCRAVKQNPELLDEKYDLTPLEKDRIIYLLEQSRGIGTSCMLYQINRFTPLYDLMPYTCNILGERTREYTRQFWAYYPKSNFQFKDEVMIFSKFLLEQISLGNITHIPILESLVNLEMAGNCIRFAVTDNVPSQAITFLESLGTANRLLFSRYDVVAMLAAMDQLGAGVPIDYEAIAAVNSFYLVHFTDRRFAVQMLSDAEATAIIEESMDRAQLNTLLATLV